MLRATFLRTALAAAVLSGTAAAATAAQPLKLEVYSADAKSMFPVASELVTGDTDAVLIDAQFQRNDAEALVQKTARLGQLISNPVPSRSTP